MSFSLNSLFSELLTRLELNPTRVRLASERYAGLKAQIETNLPVTVKQIGSFQRNTKIRPSAESNHIDVDVLVSFGTTKRVVSGGSGMTPAIALSRVRSAITTNGIYDSMRPQTDAPTVIVDYSDDFTFELVPAFEFLAHNRTLLTIATRPNHYVVAGGNGSWLVADYDFDAKTITSLNQSKSVGGILVPFIKIAKGFFRSIGLSTISGGPVKSFHLEILASEFIPRAIQTWNSQNLQFHYGHLLAQFLQEASSVIDLPAQLPGSVSPPVKCDADFLQMIQIKKRLSDAGQNAWDLCKRGRKCPPDC